jgi:hypothetical protein
MHIRTLPFALVATLLFTMHGAYAAGSISGTTLKPTKTSAAAGGLPMVVVGEPVGEAASGARPAATLVR